MVGVPVFCPHCGLLFPSQVFQGPSYNFTLQGNTEMCPNCYKQAIIADGTYTIANDTLTLLEGPEFTVELLKEFGQLLKKIKFEVITPDQFKAEAEAISPVFKPVAEKIVQNTHWFIIAYLLYTILSNVSFVIKLDAKVDINKLIEQAYEMIYQSDEAEDTETPNRDKPSGSSTHQNEEEG